MRIEKTTIKFILEALNFPGGNFENTHHYPLANISILNNTTHHVIHLQVVILDLLGGCGISMEGGFDRLGRIPGVELGPGVESPLGVGVLDFSPGVPALSRCHREKHFINIQDICIHPSIDLSTWSIQLYAKTKQFCLVHPYH